MDVKKVRIICNRQTDRKKEGRQIMFLKIVHFEEGECNSSESSSLYEGKHIETIWQNKKKGTPLRFAVDGAFIDIEGDRKKEIYIMNNEGKTIDRITRESKLTEKRLKEQMKK